MAVTSAAQRQLSDGNSQGTILGLSATDLIGFYGVTSAVARSSGSASALSGINTQDAVTVSSASSTGAYGYSTSSAANQILVLVNEIRRVMVALNLMKGS